MGGLVSNENDSDYTTLNQTQDEINAIADKWDMSSFDEENPTDSKKVQAGDMDGPNEKQVGTLPQIDEQREQQSTINEITGIRQRKHLALNIVTRGIGLESSDSEDEPNTER